MRISDWSSDVCSSDLLGLPSEFESLFELLDAGAIVPAPYFTHQAVPLPRGFEQDLRACGQHFVRRRFCPPEKRQDQGPQEKRQGTRRKIQQDLVQAPFDSDKPLFEAALNQG